jgi:predicted HTH domain antitoxin
MELSVPDEIAAETGCSSSEMLFDLAVGLFLDGRLTLGRAAALAGQPRISFLEELGRRRIPMPYNDQDLAADVQTLREIFPSSDSRKT